MNRYHDLGEMQTLVVDDLGVSTRNFAEDQLQSCKIQHAFSSQHYTAILTRILQFNWLFSRSKSDIIVLIPCILEMTPDYCFIADSLPYNKLFLFNSSTTILV